MDLNYNCPVCKKERNYKTQTGYRIAKRDKKPCRSCANSFSAGGNGVCYKEGKRKCSECGEYKDFSFFIFIKAKNNYHSSCKECSKKLSKNYSKNIYRFKKYNLTKEDYQKILIKQNYKCAICGEKKENLYIDHNHKNNNIRGLLCRDCNSALGLLKENIKILEKSIKYLKEN